MWILLVPRWIGLGIEFSLITQCPGTAGPHSNPPSLLTMNMCDYSVWERHFSACDSPSLLFDMRLDLNLYVHLLKRQLCNPNTGPKRLMLRTPLLQPGNHKLKHEIIQRRAMIAHYLVDLAPPRTAGSLDGDVDVFEGLRYLGSEIVRDLARVAAFSVPAACRCQCILPLMMAT